MAQRMSLKAMIGGGGVWHSASPSCLLQISFLSGFFGIVWSSGSYPGRIIQYVDT